MPAAKVILASSSRSRARLLSAAGVVFEAVPPVVDEDAVKSALRADKADALNCAETLAELKAVKVSRARPEALVIGADQMLECEGEWFDKPASLAEAATHLRRLSGKVHALPTAAVVAQGGRPIWHHISVPRLMVRPLSAAFITAYLDQTGESALTSVGAYQLEGLGAQMFASVEGDFFTILGLPLLPLLAFLRARGAVLP
jgi:septum formation protein